MLGTLPFTLHYCDSCWFLDSEIIGVKPRKGLAFCDSGDTKISIAQVPALGDVICHPGTPSLPHYAVKISIVYNTKAG